MRIPILTYQPMRIDGNDYRSNDLCALAADLRRLTALGFRIMPLRSIVDAWLDDRAAGLDGRIVAITSDNGADFDYVDLVHPVAGPQRSLVNVLRDFGAEHPGEQPALNVTSFVIASPEARAWLDRTCMVGKGWWNDAWWPEAVATGLIHIGNHSWDHNHETLPPGFVPSPRRGTFLSVDCEELADHEIRTAAQCLGELVPNPGTGLFAYPYGESNGYLVHEYLPEYHAELGIRAAFGTRRGFLEPGTGRWEIPRFVFGRDWSAPGELDAILDEAASGRARMPARRTTRPPRERAGDAGSGPGAGALREFAQFIAAKVEPIPGWLHPEAALLTGHLAATQHGMHLRGPTLEIGVYRGKYLSVLYKASAAGESVLGVDLFVGSNDTAQDVAAVSANVAAACGDASRLRILVTDSLALTSGRVLEAAGGKKFRFVSIDGGHTPELVSHDLETAYPALADGGIMALDDIFNPLVPGVVEGVAGFFLQRRPELAPFAYCFNKLFVTTPRFHAQYLRATLAFLDQVPWLRTQERTQQVLSENRANGFTPALFGYELVTFEP